MIETFSIHTSVDDSAPFGISDGRDFYLDKNKEIKKLAFLPPHVEEKLISPIPAWLKLLSRALAYNWEVQISTANNNILIESNRKDWTNTATVQTVPGFSSASVVDFFEDRSITIRHENSDTVTDITISLKDLSTLSFTARTSALCPAVGSIVVLDAPSHPVYNVAGLNVVEIFEGMIDPVSLGTVIGPKRVQLPYQKLDQQAVVSTVEELALFLWLMRIIDFPTSNQVAQAVRELDAGSGPLFVYVGENHEFKFIHAEQLTKLLKPLSSVTTELLENAS